MLFWLTELSDGGDFYNLFRYITFRAGGAFLTALIFGFLFGKPLINVLRKKQGKGQPIRDDGPEGHFVKAGTPTMGGLLIVGALLTSTLIWARWDNPFVWLVLFVTLSFGLIGFADDYAKVSKQNTAGVPGKVRLLLGILIAIIAALWASAYHPEALQNQLAMPVFKDALTHIVLPASLLGYYSLAYISRMTRSFMLEQLSAEYITTARVKGMSESAVIWRHAFKNIRVQLITVIALSYANLLEGSVLTEIIFSWPGIGSYITTALLSADMNAVMGGTVVVGLIFILLNILSDLLYKIFDPRAR